VNEGQSRREELLAAALAEFLDQQANEESISLTAFLQNHPDLEADLRLALAAVSEMDQATAAGEPAVATLEPAALPARQAEPTLPETLSGLRVMAEIGTGGMGRVLLAEDARLGRKVAIKTLHPRYAGNVDLRERFMREARAMAAINHSGIVRIYNLGPDNEPPHFVMEYVEGAPLTEAARALTFAQKAELLHQVLLAVAFLHEHRIIHRDLKPGNILVGHDLAPKLLDFGLALETRAPEPRLTHAGQIVGTPDYLSPEQVAAAPLDARSDIFSLGILFYELLTGELPFQAAGISEQMRAICEQDPILPRRVNAGVPAELQNICLKALEKDPALRYSSAREMAADIERFLAGEPVTAIPASYSRMVAGKIEQHLRELEGWKTDGILNQSEHDALGKAYRRLSEREDAWILETRRLSLQQVTLYLGGWLLVVGAALLVLMRYPALHGITAVLLAGAASLLTGGIGLRLWKRGQHRLAIAFLLAFCLLLPVTLLVGMGEYGIFAAATRGREDLELFSKVPDFHRTSNAQLWWAILLSLPVYWSLRLFTGSSVFSLVLAVFAALWSPVWLLRMGLLEWLDKDPGRPYFYLVPWAIAFLAAALTVERLRRPDDSRYIYPFFVLFAYVALSGLAAFHQPYANWLKSVAPWTRGQQEYLFLLSAGIYLVLQTIFEIPSSSQLRAVARAFRFVIPGHVLIPLLLLGIAATDRWHDLPGALDRRFEARLFEILLPIAAAVFVFASIPKQMKNFFASGLVFLAIGIVRMQQDLFNQRALWPTCLLAAGLILMLAASRYSPLKMGLARLWGRP
jgi:predicted Ser/Thr protein kinase